ncbi:MAG: serine/threonine protein kinase [Gammaproteobacteria bacterium]|nr:serine/threonine protein kinase [Gammaproteobacteria bacterium]MDH3857423.1 serine/threonine protein kinase [Gammaproteobacteria bacterium]
MEENPQMIGKYQVKSLLGEGGIGVVYEGYDPDIQRRVAIKVLHPHLISGKAGEELLARFKREAISAARCIHPNVVTILEYGQHENQPFIIMEYVNGVSVHRLIKHRLKHGRGISLRRGLSIISQLLGALHTAHRLNIVHRDIKASNVLILNKSGRIKLTDFGMARLMENSDLTMIGSFMGTPRYMAPELRFGLEADCRADVFSAARLFLELLKMVPESSPFQQSRLPEIANMPPGNRIDYSANYPTALIPVVIRGLQVDREERYQTVLEFMQAIKRVLPRLQQKATTSSGQVATIKRASVPDIGPSEDELKSMTTLLTDIVGPSATLIMGELETKSTSANNLAIEISKEIPEQEKRAEFLERWEMMSVSRRTLINKDELNSMTTLLTDIVGPSATLIMEEHETKSASANNLAIEISKEIPEQEKQEEFLRRWEMMSTSRRALINKKRSGISPEMMRPQPQQDEAPDITGNDFVHYIGKVAKTWLRN